MVFKVFIFFWKDSDFAKLVEGIRNKVLTDRLELLFEIQTALDALNTIQLLKGATFAPICLK